MSAGGLGEAGMCLKRHLWLAVARCVNEDVCHILLA